MDYTKLSELPDILRPLSDTDLFPVIQEIVVGNGIYSARKHSFVDLIAVTSAIIVPKAVSLVSLNSLADLYAPCTITGQALTYDSTDGKFHPRTYSPHAIEDSTMHSDFTVSGSLQTGQALVFDASTRKWENSYNVFHDLSAHINFALEGTTITSGQVITYDSSIKKWKNSNSANYSLDFDYVMIKGTLSGNSQDSTIAGDSLTDITSSNSSIFYINKSNDSIYSAFLSSYMQLFPILINSGTIKTEIDVFTINSNEADSIYSDQFVTANLIIDWKMNKVFGEYIFHRGLQTVGVFRGDDAGYLSGNTNAVVYFTSLHGLLSTVDSHTTNSYISTLSNPRSIYAIPLGRFRNLNTIANFQIKIKNYYYRQI